MVFSGNDLLRAEVNHPPGRAVILELTLFNIRKGNKGTLVGMTTQDLGTKSSSAPYLYVYAGKVRQGDMSNEERIFWFRCPIRRSPCRPPNGAQPGWLRV